MSGQWFDGDEFSSIIRREACRIIRPDSNHALCRGDGDANTIPFRGVIHFYFRKFMIWESEGIIKAQFPEWHNCPITPISIPKERMFIDRYDSSGRVILIICLENAICSSFQHHVFNRVSDAKRVMVPKGYWDVVVRVIRDAIASSESLTMN